MAKANEKKVMDFFMNDSQWLKKFDVEKKTIKETEKKTEAIRSDQGMAIETSVNETGGNKLRDEDISRNQEDIISKKEFGEVDYAILKSITCDFKNINEIAKALQIRTIVIEKHTYNLIKEGYIKYFQYCILTSKGKNAIKDFEINNPEDVWKPIEKFIISTIEYKKERNLKIQRMFDLVLLIAVIILIILIIYFLLS